MIIFIVVDLPAPFGPKKPSTSPRATSNDTSFDGKNRAEAPMQMAHVDHRVHANHVSPGAGFFGPIVPQRAICRISPGKIKPRRRICR